MEMTYKLPFTANNLALGKIIYTPYMLYTKYGLALI